MTSHPDDPPAPPHDSPHDIAPPGVAEPPGAPPEWPPTPSSGSLPAYAPPPRAPSEALSPWVHIWTKPRAVMRQILDTNPRRMVHVLAMLAGVAGAMAPNQINVPGFAIPLGVIIVMKVILGVAVSLLALYLVGFLMTVTGKWLGGRGNFTAVRAALAWSNVPAIWMALLWLPLFVYMGWEAFNLNLETLIGDPVGVWLLVPIVLLAIVGTAWRFVILFKCLGEAHGFSAWHALGASLIALVLLAIPIVILVFFAITLLGLAVLGSH